MSNGMLTLQEVMQFLNVDKSGVEELVRKDQLTAYKIGGVYLRFRKEQVMSLKQSIQPKEIVREQAFAERVKDFWDLNNFYIVAGMSLLLILYFALR